MLIMDEILTRLEQAMTCLISVQNSLHELEEVAKSLRLAVGTYLVQSAKPAFQPPTTPG